MKTVEQNRRDWLEKLITEYGSIAELNIKLSRDRTDATLSQIRNQSPHYKTGKPRSMGSNLARKIEEKLDLKIGALDHPPASYEYKTPLSSQAKIEPPAHSVNEPIAPYSTLQKWPFTSIRPDEWFNLATDTRRMLESQIRSLIPLDEQNAEAA